MNQSQPEPKAALPLPASAPDDLWQMALGDLRYQMTKATFNNWLGDSRILVAASSPFFLVVVVRNIYAWEWLTYRLRRIVTRTVVGIAGDGVTICFIPRTIQRNNDELTRRPMTRML
jgi:chromosomal replication initiation ATPase DnaA